MLQSMLKAGTNGTNGTLNRKLVVFCSCASIINRPTIKTNIFTFFVCFEMHAYFLNHYSVKNSGFPAPCLTAALFPISLEISKIIVTKKIMLG